LCPDPKTSLQVSKKPFERLTVNPTEVRARAWHRRIKSNLRARLRNPFRKIFFQRRAVAKVTIRVRTSEVMRVEKSVSPIANATSF
jgi:hypothetical protein